MVIGGYGAVSRIGHSHHTLTEVPELHLQASKPAWSAVVSDGGNSGSVILRG